MATLIKEICATAKDQTGLLHKATTAIREVGVNINGFCAFSRDAIGQLHFITDNNPRAIDSLQRAGFRVTEDDVVITTLVHRSGSLDVATHRLAEAGVDIRYSYATVAGSISLVIFATDNNKQALELLGRD